MPDIRTLLLIFALICTLSIVAFVLLLPKRKEFASPPWYLLGFLLMVIGSSLNAGQGVLSPWLSIVLSNVLLSGALVSFWQGIHLTALGTSLSRRRVVVSMLLLLLLAANGAYYSMVTFSYPIRQLTLMIVQAIFLFATSATLFAAPAYMHSARVLSFLFGIVGVGALVRGGMDFWLPADTAFHHAGLPAAIFLMLAISMVVSVTVGLLTMLNETLLQQLQDRKDILEENIRLREEVEAITRHDLRAPISPVISLADMLLLDHSLPDEAEETVRLMRSSAQKALDTVNHSLDMCKLEQGRYALQCVDMDLLRVVAETERELMGPRERSYLPVRRVLNGTPAQGGEHCLICGDESMLARLLSNLLLNAFEAAYSARGDETEDIVLRVDELGDKVRLEVENAGEVPPEVRDRFFEKYATHGKTGGTGLGTYSIRLIAEAHGGTAYVDFATPGRTVTGVFLPKNC